MPESYFLPLQTVQKNTASKADATKFSTLVYENCWLVWHIMLVIPARLIFYQGTKWKGAEEEEGWLFKRRAGPWASAEWHSSNAGYSSFS